MARTGTRRHKGCAMCKYWKCDQYGDAVRMPFSAKKALGKNKRVSRKAIPGDY